MLRFLQLLQDNEFINNLVYTILKYKDKSNNLLAVPTNKD